MNKDRLIKVLLPDTVCITPEGFVADKLKIEDFEKMHKEFFNKIFEISKANIGDITGYGEFNDDLTTNYKTCRDFLIDTFSQEKEGYWYNWMNMFETTMMTRDLFFKFYKKMEELIKFCEEQRFLVNNATWFESIITDGKKVTGFPDWSRSGICDYLIDFVIMDLNKPYLQIPELLVKYCKEESIEIPNFKERYLCMAFYKGLDVLRWHASIDDTESCESIIKYLDEIEDRIMSL
jgi:hygromycin-B 4-O-kinase